MAFDIKDISLDMVTLTKEGIASEKLGGQFRLFACLTTCITGSYLLKLRKYINSGPTQENLSCSLSAIQDVLSARFCSREAALQVGYLDETVLPSNVKNRSHHIPNP